MDSMTKAARSALMSRIRSKNTAPEKIIRSLIHRLGYRFRIHRDDLPGKPDIVLPMHGKIILVHGCFWHGHSSCNLASKPKSNITYWSEKIKSNRGRDRRNKRKLISQGWTVLEIWECEVRRLDGLDGRVLEFLRAPTTVASSPAKRRR